MMHFLTGTELQRGDLLALLDSAEQLKKDREKGKLSNELKGKTLAMMFEKPSLRTHLSFSVAMQELGGQVVDSFSANRKKEEPEDVAQVVSGYCHGVMIRTHEHSILERFVSKTKIPVINGLSDAHHPCQILADLQAIKQTFGKFDGLKLSYIGDGNNILHSLLLLAPMAGMSVSYACPQGYEPLALVLKQARHIARETGAKIEATTDPQKAVKGADAIYTDVWTSMGFEEQGKSRDSAFQGFQLNAKLHALANKDAAIMHCLPMVRGKEITDDMADHPRSIIFKQSENRLHAQKALLARMLGTK
ncbi:MAG TPA: ornithine carbamoyltransferase [Bdellovibrionota bacterium]